MTARVLRLARTDDVAVVLDPLAAGEVADGLVAREPVPAGHKIALRDLAPGAPIHKYGHVIGVATAAITAGDHVHVHNVGMPGGGSRATGGASQAISAVPDDLPRTFQGIVRPDGRIATRNYVAVLTTVNCSATVAKLVARRTEDHVGALHADGVDGVVALTHGSGCGMADSGPGWDVLRRTLTGYARHPNVGGVVVVGLGCEVNALSSLVEEIDVPVASYTIQDAGGTAAAVTEGVEQVHRMAERLRGTTRTTVGVENLVLGMQCGGSDAWSALTANPALGVASDYLVALGGTSLLGETPEIYGAEQMLADRAVDDGVRDALLDRITWWERYTTSQGTTLDGNPSPGNKAGGITTILEKSLGAIAKGGHSPLAEVVDYAEAPSRRGLIFMDTPGYDPVSATGMVAGGAHLIAFTTGRGSAFGSRPVPTVKLASNAALARQMSGDIDVDCSGVVETGRPLAEVGAEVYRRLIAVASGERSVSEELGVGGEEIVPWQLGAVL
ncbi:UxaA family hydrolase [Cryptosporangium aurantiacum]|uniref:Altronate hydrolase n=1 Tax=Cryptosporangium aurantiacum TaxID=134849 RepID=A0A1M7RPS4_9ACTN|nr:altronate dehydratase family protein [Cryptosporangium aurantiacum]SHN48096.1 altronate hydrolase [Cryptosporangium aurantiacum]